MIADARSIPAGLTLTADICIVGAGPVGIALALALANAGRSLLLVEAGGEEPDTAIQALHTGMVADPVLHPPPNEYRERRLGGSTTIWGGRCVPFDAIDFVRRDWVHDSGWPISAAALDAYYPRANRLCEAGAYAYTVDRAFDRDLPPMIAGFSGTAFRDDTLERFSRPTDFGRRYRARLQSSPRITLLLHANLTRIDRTEDGGRVERLTIARTDGTHITVASRQTVLAAGGLETARLLLANDIGAEHDVVGRYYMSHIAGTTGRFRVDGPVHHGYDIADDGTFCRKPDGSGRPGGAGNIMLRQRRGRSGTSLSEAIRGVSFPVRLTEIIKRSQEAKGFRFSLGDGLSNAPSHGLADAAALPRAGNHHRILHCMSNDSLYPHAYPQNRRILLRLRNFRVRHLEHFHDERNRRGIPKAIIV